LPEQYLQKRSNKNSVRNTAQIHKGNEPVETGKKLAKFGTHNPDHINVLASRQIPFIFYTTGRRTFGHAPKTRR